MFHSKTDTEKRAWKAFETDTGKGERGQIAIPLPSEQ